MYKSAILHNRGIMEFGAKMACYATVYSSEVPLFICLEISIISGHGYILSTRYWPHRWQHSRFLGHCIWTRGQEGHQGNWGNLLQIWKRVNTTGGPKGFGERHPNMASRPFMTYGIDTTDWLSIPKPDCIMIDIRSLLNSSLIMWQNIAISTWSNQWSEEMVQFDFSSGKKIWFLIWCYGY